MTAGEQALRFLDFGGALRRSDAGADESPRQLPLLGAWQRARTSVNVLIHSS